MRNKIIVIVALLLLMMDISSCRMRQPGVSRTYFHPYRTHRHWGRERHVNVKRQFWGRHRSGMRPYRHRGQQRF